MFLEITEITCVLFVVVPRTSLIGGVLIASERGGPLAAHIRVGQPFIALGVLGVPMWIGRVPKETAIRNAQLRPADRQRHL